MNARRKAPKANHGRGTCRRCSKRVALFVGREGDLLIENHNIKPEGRKYSIQCGGSAGHPVEGSVRLPK